MKTIKKAYILVVMILAVTLLLTICAFSEDDHGGVLDYGDCGENLTWTLYNDGLLEISGTGAMEDYSSHSQDAWPYGGSYVITDATWGVYYKKMKSLKLNYGLTSIGSHAFNGCISLTDNLTIPESVESIGEYAFNGCSEFNGSLTIPSKVTSIGNNTFYGCSGFTGSLTIPDNVESIGEYAFYDCSGLTGDLIIPNSVKSIGVFAFCYCGGLTGDITISDDVTVISDSSFRGCSGLTSVTIGNSVSEIQNYAFKDCTSLSDIYFNGNAPTLHEGMFDNCADGLTMYCYQKYSHSFITYGGKWNGYPLVIIDDVVSPSGGTVSLKTGDTYQIVYDNPDVAGWISMNTAAATVSNNGLITAVGEGTAIIRAYDSSFNTIGGIYNVTVTSAPSFGKHSLVLSGKIGVMFRVSFPEGFDPENCYVDFVAKDGRASTVNFDSAETIANTNDRYFTFYINALELADTITATLHYGNGETSTDEYSALAYIKYVQNNLSDNRDLLNLVNALHDYGYYMQNSGWNDEFPSHTVLSDIAQQLITSDINMIRNNVADMRVKKDLDNSGIIDYRISLTLNADTAINFFVKLDHDVAISSCKDQNGNNVRYKKTKIQGETYYQITTEKINAGNLGKEYTFTIETTIGTASLTASAMSYVEAVLKENSSFTSAKQYAMAAFYNYYLAAVTYLNNN